MLRPARIISLASLPKLLIREQTTNKLRHCQLDFVTLNSPTDPEYILTVLTLAPLLGKTLDMQVSKDTHKVRLLCEGEDVAKIVLKKGAAKINQSEVEKTGTVLYDKEEREALRHSYRGSEGKTVDYTVEGERLTEAVEKLPQPFVGSVLWLPKGLFVIGEELIPVTLKQLDFQPSCAPEELLGEFLISHCSNIPITLSDPILDLCTNTTIVQCTLPIAPTLQLLRKGWSSLLHDRQSTPNDTFSLMLEATSIAKSSFRGIWKLTFDVFLLKNYEQPFEGIIHEVIQGHQYRVRRDDGTILNIELERVVCPTHQQSGAYECFEFARKMFIGKKVIVWVERNRKMGWVRSLVAMREEEELVDKMLMERGLAVLRGSGRQDQQTAIFKKMERFNKEEKNGLYAHQSEVFRFQDLTKLRRKAQIALAKQFADRVILQTDNPQYSGILQSITSPSTFILKLPFHRAILPVKLSSVESLTSQSKKPQYLQFLQSSKQYLIETLLQRDVKLQLVSFDQDLRTFVGNIWVNGRLVTEELLYKGLVYVEEGEGVSEEMVGAQEKAKERKIGVWAESLGEILGERERDQVESFQAIVSYVEDGRKIYYQRLEDFDKLENIVNPALEDLNPKKMSPIKYTNSSELNRIILAPFEGALYRAVIVQDEAIRKAHEKNLTKKDQLVQFIDYGNRQIVSKLKIFPCPQQISSIPPLSSSCELSLTLPIQPTNQMSQKAKQHINNSILNKQILMVIKRLSGLVSRRYIKLTLAFPQHDLDIRKSLNFEFVKAGALKIDKRHLMELLREDERAELVAREQKAKKKAELLWFSECENDEEGERLMGMRGFNQAMRSNY